MGPKLYDADWQDLTMKGHIAKADGAEVWHIMRAELYREYSIQTVRRKRILSIMNPTKIQICEHLIVKHKKRGNKIIVFSDSVLALMLYAKELGKPFIHGQLVKLNV